MPFDPKSVQVDLRPISVVRNVNEDSRMAPVTSSGRPVEGFYGNQRRDGAGNANASAALPAVYYPSTASETNFVPIGYNNNTSAVPSGWVHHVVPSQAQPTIGSPKTVSSLGGYKLNSPNYRAGPVSDQASEDGGDDSASGRKIKFLCSFGGKILPRPSDGALRYVGGKTRIISVRKDVSFYELVQKMMDVYSQDVVIKYQLPDEELDALVSVSCPDDLEHMMDEYDKLVEQSPSGSAKLRIFLFAPSESDSPMHLHDGGYSYVEAVNGVMDGFSGSGDSGRIARKESIESTGGASQTSDLSGTDGCEGSSHVQGEPVSFPNESLDTPLRMMHLDPNPLPYTDTSRAQLGIPMVQSSPMTDQSGENYPVASHYVQPYHQNPHQENYNRATYVQLPMPTGYPGQIMGSVRPMYTQKSLSPQQFAHSGHMAMSPTLMSMNSVQAQQPVHYPASSMVSQRPVQFPTDQGYSMHHAQVLMQGVYNWRQVPHPEHVVLSETVRAPENLPRSEDCSMCQKQLPHAHSDTVAQEIIKENSTNQSDPRLTYHSLRLDDRQKPVMRPVVTEGGLAVVGEDVHDEAILQKVERSQQPASSYGMFVANNPQYYQASAGYNAVTQPKWQVAQETTVERPMNTDFASRHESPRGYYGNFVIGSPKEDSASFGHSRQVDGRLENLHRRRPSGNFSNSEENIVIGSPKEDSTSFGHSRQVDGRLENLHRRRPSGNFSNSEENIVIGSPKEDSASFGHSRQVDGRLENLHRRRPSGNFTNSEENIVIGSPKEDSMSFGHSRQVDGRLENLHRRRPSGNFNYSEENIVIGSPKEDSASFGHLRQVDGRLENLHRRRPSGNFTSSEENIVIGSPKEDSASFGHLRQNDGRLENKHRRPSGNLTNSEDNNPPPSMHTVYNLVAKDVTGHPYAGFDSVQATEKAVSICINEWPDNILSSQPNIPCEIEALALRGDNMSSVSPSYRVGDSRDNSESLFSNQDPWNLQNDAHKVSMEEVAKQELQVVAEGVAASVLHSPGPSNPDLLAYATDDSPLITQQTGEVQRANVDNVEEKKTKLTDKITPGFSASDGVGRLQMIKNSDLEELRELGSGTFGTVYHGKWRGTDVAIKRINDRCFAAKPSEQERMRDDFWNEAVKLGDLHHPNVVAFYGVVLDGPEGSVSTVTEYMVNGSLRNALQKSERGVDKRKRLLIGMDVAFGMEYLHGKNIVHFDLKSDNLLVNLRDPHRPICKVGDLGLSKVKCQTLISGGVRGTLPWMAPELLNGSSSLVCEKIDVFSFGIVMWELLTGEEPYADLHYGAIIGGIVSNTLRPPVPENCDPMWRTLMERCWAAEPPQRPSFTEIANELRAMAAKLPAKGQA